MNAKATTQFSLPTVLFLIFLVLKLTGHIAWSWWWVTSPIWIQFLLIVAVILWTVLVYRSKN